MQHDCNISQLCLVITYTKGQDRTIYQINAEKLTFDEAIVMSTPNIEMDLKSEPRVYIAEGLIIWIGCSRA